MGYMQKCTCVCESQRAPSKYSPEISTPSAGLTCSVTHGSAPWKSRGASSVGGTTRSITEKPNETVSIGLVYLRAKFCSAPVMNAWGKKKPDTQNTLGMPESFQKLTKQSRFSRSTSQPASGLSEGYALPLSFHISGIWLLKSAE